MNEGGRKVVAFGRWTVVRHDPLCAAYDDTVRKALHVRYFSLAGAVLCIHGHGRQSVRNAAMQKNDQRHTTDDDLSHLARIVSIYFIWEPPLAVRRFYCIAKYCTCTFLLPQICRGETAVGAQLLWQPRQRVKVYRATYAEVFYCATGCIAYNLRSA
jgi:hypothetical protein